MTNWIIYVCLCILLCTSKTFGMQAFELIEVDPPLKADFKSLLESPLGLAVGAPVNPIESSDRYSLAIYLNRCIRKLRTKPLQNFNDHTSLETLKTLIKSLSPEISMLRQNAEEFILEVESRINTPVKRTQQEAQQQKINVDSIQIQAQGGSKNYGDLQSLIDLTLVGLDKVEGLLRVGVQQRSDKELNPIGEARLHLDEARIAYTADQYISELKLGKYNPDIGLGLSTSSSLTGGEILKKYHEYEFQLGYYDGLFAAVTSPVFFDLPVTFYTMHERSKRQGDNFSQQYNSDKFHSGLYFEHKSNTYNLRTELVEFNRPDLKTQKVNDQRSFALSLNLFPFDKFNFGGSLVHTGEEFAARQGRGRNSQINYFNEDTSGLQAEVLKSLSRFFGKEVYTIPGTSDIRFNINYKATDKSSLELHFNKLYDHTRYEINKYNSFNLSTLNFRQKMNHNSELMVSFQNLIWDQDGIAQNGFMTGYARDNMQTIQTAYKFAF